VTRRFDRRTVVISGAARGQGRSHALRFAAEGANVALFDLCAQLDTVSFAMGTKDELDETAAMARKHGGGVITAIADVRDWDQVHGVFEQARSEFGGVDVALANAGIVGRHGKVWEVEEQVFRDVLDVNLVGAWHVVKAAILAMRTAGRSGSIVVTGSGASLKGTPNISPYVASKHALVGLVRSSAREVAPDGIRVNLVAPGNTGTPMLLNEPMYRLSVPEVDVPTAEMFKERAASAIPMGIPYVDPEDITEAVMFLASDAAR
jgi:SDR family mycofactocin-dependent oxidoreductase